MNRDSIGGRHTVVALVVVLGLAAGCGSSLDSTVSGSVTLDGKPLAIGDGTGAVSFYPVGGGPAAQAKLAPDGTYALKTGSAAGIRAGEYRVTVVATGPSPKPLPGASPSPGPLLTPPRYGTTEGSGLQFTVARGSNKIDIALTSQ